MKKSILLLVLCITVHLITSAQSISKKDSIFSLAESTNKSILMLFSGSDWCPNCIRFEKQILKDPTFQQFSDSTLLLFIVDFPQRKKQSASLKIENELLAEEFNPQGIFPTLLLTKPHSKPVYITYEKESATEFLQKLIIAESALMREYGTQN